MRDVEFNVRDKVSLKLTPQIWKKISIKAIHRGLIPKYDGLFEVVAKEGNIAYKVMLLERLKVHSIFHVSLLKKFHEDMAEFLRSQATRAASIVRKQFDDQIWKIMNNRTLEQSKKNRMTEFLIQWKDKSIIETTWEMDTILHQFEKQIEEYLQALLTRTLAPFGGLVCQILNWVSINWDGVGL